MTAKKLRVLFPALLLIYALALLSSPRATTFSQEAKPQGKTTEMVAMRDGVRLATDIFLPEGKGPWPVVLTRGEDKSASAQSRAWVTNGYAFVVQDCRGRFKSEGKYMTTSA